MGSLWEVLTTETWLNNSLYPPGSNIQASPSPDKSTTITLSSPSVEPSKCLPELLEPLNSQLLDKNSPETHSSPDGARSEETSTSSQPNFKSSNSQSSLTLNAPPSGEEQESPHNPSASEDQPPALEHATETLAVQWSKPTPTVSPGSSETPPGEHHHATHLSTQPSTPRTPLLPTGSNNKCKELLFTPSLISIQ